MGAGLILSVEGDVKISSTKFVTQNAGKLRDYYRIGKMLGSGRFQFGLINIIGAFGEVRMCVHRETGAQRAVKVLRKSHMDEDEKKMLFNEINILRELVSPPFRADMPYFIYYGIQYEAYL